MIYSLEYFTNTLVTTAILGPENKLSGVVMTSNQLICPDVPRFDDNILTGTSTIAYVNFYITYNKQEIWGLTKL